MPEFLVGQPGQAGSGQVLRHILGTALRDEKQSFSELWRRTWASTLSLMHLSLCSEFNAAALEALRVFQGLQFASVPSMPGQAGRGPITRVTFSPWLPQPDPSQYHLPAPISLPFLHPHFSLKLFNQLPPGSASTGTSGEVQPPTMTKIGQKSSAGGRGEELAPFFGSRSDWNSDDPAKAAGSISS